MATPSVGKSRISYSTSPAVGQDFRDLLSDGRGSRGSEMRIIVMTAAAAIAVAGCSAQQPAAENKQAGAAQRPSEAESEAYMRKAEADWADLAVRAIPGLMERIMADDYVGVSSGGDVRDKAKQVEDAKEGPSGEFVSSKLDYVNYRHF